MLRSRRCFWVSSCHAGILSRILSTPRDAEVTGITLSYVGDQAYYTFAIQHPLELDDGTYPHNAQEVNASSLPGQAKLSCICVDVPCICAQS